MVVAHTRFVGRAAELARLQESWADVLGGRPVMYAIGGDAGIGKSRLVREFLDRAAADGATGLVGGCLDLAEGSLPFWPFVAAIRDYTTSLGDAERAELLGPPESDCRGSRRPGCAARWRAARPRRSDFPRLGARRTTRRGRYATGPSCVVV